MLRLIMRVSQKFSLTNYDSQNGTSLLAANGTPLDIQVDGKTLENQFSLADGDSLIWLTDNSIYDEGLHIYLFDSSNAVQDALEAGSTFNGGVLEIISFEKNSVIFRFFKNDVTYQLIIEEHPKVKFFLAAGWKYKSSFKKHQLLIEEC